MQQCSWYHFHIDFLNNEKVDRQSETMESECGREYRYGYIYLYSFCSRCEQPFRTETRPFTPQASYSKTLLKTLLSFSVCLHFLVKCAVSLSVFSFLCSGLLKDQCDYSAQQSNCFWIMGVWIPLHHHLNHRLGIQIPNSQNLLLQTVTAMQYAYFVNIP